MIYQGTLGNYDIEFQPSTWPGPGPDYPYTRVVHFGQFPLDSGGQALVFLYFVPAGRPIPASGVRASTAPLVFDISAPMEDYPAVVEMLRLEAGPFKFYFDESDPGGWVLRTGDGPVGEERFQK